MEKVIELNNTIDRLIDDANKEYTKSTDAIEQARLYGKIKAYMEIQNRVKVIFEVEQ